MNISTADRETIREILQESLRELSISELSRKSGINRNKVSLITETLTKEGIVQCTRHSTAKKFILIQQTPVQVLLEVIPEPAIILDAMLRVVSVNPALLAEIPDQDPGIIGQPVQSITRFPLTGLLPELSRILAEKPEGYRVNLHPASCSYSCTGIRVTVGDNKPGLLIIINRKEITRSPEWYHHLLDSLVHHTPELLRTGSTQETVRYIAGIIHETLDPDYTITGCIDEHSRTITLNSLHLSRSYRKPTRPEIDQVLSINIPLPISPIEILRFKNGQNVTYSGISGLLGSYPQELAPFLDPLCTCCLTVTSLICNDSKIRIVGIGRINEPFSEEMIQKILTASTRVVTLFDIIHGKTAENQHLVSEYQEKYRELYTRLTEKTREYLAHNHETASLRSLIGIILDQIEISCISVNRDGIISSANQTLLQILGIHEKELIKSPDIHQILPVPLTEALTHLMQMRKDKATPGSQMMVVPIPGHPTMYWLRIRTPDTETPDTDMFLGEADPAPFLHYLRTQEIHFSPGYQGNCIRNQNQNP